MSTTTLATSSRDALLTQLRDPSREAEAVAALQADPLWGVYASLEGYGAVRKSVSSSLSVPAGRFRDRWRFGKKQETQNLRDAALHALLSSGPLSSHIGGITKHHQQNEAESPKDKYMDTLLPIVLRTLDTMGTAVRCRKAQENPRNWVDLCRAPLERGPG